MKIDKELGTFTLTIFSWLSIEISHDNLMYAFGFEATYFPGDREINCILSIFKIYIVTTLGKKRKIK